MRRHEARRAFLDTITHRCATETLRPFTDRDYPLISHGPSTIRSHRYPLGGRERVRERQEEEEKTLTAQLTE